MYAYDLDRAKGSGIAQLRYQKREKALSLSKISINILTFPGGPSDHKQKLQVQVRLQVFIHLLYFGLSGLDLKLLFMVTGACYENGLLQLAAIS